MTLDAVGPHPPRALVTNPREIQWMTPWTREGTTPVSAVDIVALSTESHACKPRPGERRAITCARTNDLYAAPMPGCPQSTPPTTDTVLLRFLYEEKCLL